jgi:hypothetical protein
LTALPADRLVEERYAKFRRMGMFYEGGEGPASSLPGEHRDLKPPFFESETAIQETD